MDYINIKEKQNFLEEEFIKIWGNIESLKSQSEEIKPGDWMLFYDKGYFCHSAQVIFTKLKSKQLARKLWGETSDGRTWSNICFLSHIQKIHIPTKIMQELAEYNRIQGFMSFRDNGITKIKKKFGSIEKFFSNYLVKSNKEI